MWIIKYRNNGDFIDYYNVDEKECFVDMLFFQGEIEKGTTSFHFLFYF